MSLGPGSCSPSRIVWTRNASQRSCIAFSTIPVWYRSGWSFRRLRSFRISSRVSCNAPPTFCPRCIPWIAEPLKRAIVREDLIVSSRTSSFSSRRDSISSITSSRFFTARGCPIPLMRIRPPDSVRDMRPEPRRTRWDGPDLVNMLTTEVLSLTSHVKTIIWPYVYISHEPRCIVRGRPVPSFVRCAWRRSIGRRPGLPDRLRQEANRPREGQRRTRLHPPQRRHLDRTVRPGHAIKRRRRTRRPNGHPDGRDGEVAGIKGRTNSVDLDLHP